MSGALTVIDPVMGEELTLADASEERLGQLLLDVREYEHRLRELKRLVSEEVVRRCDFRRQWTLHAGHLTLSTKSDARVAEWDVEGLLEELYAMVAEGLISTEAIAAAVQPRVEYKVLARGVDALLKNPTLAGRLEPYRRMVDPDGRRVTVSCP